MQAVSVQSVLKSIICVLAVVQLLALQSAFAASPDTRIIVSLHKPLTPENLSDVVASINQQLERKVTLARAMSGQSLVLVADNLNSDSAELVAELKALPQVRDVGLDAVVKPTAVDDPRFDEQWQLQAPKEFRASLDVVNAWNVTQGASDVVVAIVDTGIDYDHPDLAGRLLPGYDFVSALSSAVDSGIYVPDEYEFLRSHDGDGADNDATDPGDSISEDIRKMFDGFDIECYLGNSSWHGTAMASIIAANANDGIGIAGIDWHAKILPVRAIGKCGGHRSDLLDAIRWAAGVDDPFLPPNPTPARIINLSLGVDDHCTEADQQAIDDAIDAGAIVVAAVGNNGRNTDAQPSSPSHCQNVIGVMAVDKHGYRASYSNFGRDADVAAPGGDLLPSLNEILVATNKGATIPSAEFGYRAATGTSVAAPHVAGVLALMLSVKPSLTNRELEALLLDSTRAFPGKGDEMDDLEMRCESLYCGSGILDAFLAVQAVDAHIPGTYLDSPSLEAAQSVPVSVGSFVGFGCTVSMRKTHDPILLIFLGLSLLVILIRNGMRATQN